MDIKNANASGIKKCRIVVDYSKFNEKTKDYLYLLLNITNGLDKVECIHYFTILALPSEFHQMEMNSGKILRTAFIVENGHYNFIRMPIELKNASASFQKVMDQIFRRPQNEFFLLI